MWRQVLPTAGWGWLQPQAAHRSSSSRRCGVRCYPRPRRPNGGDEHDMLLRTMCTAMQAGITNQGKRMEFQLQKVWGLLNGL